MPPPQAFMDTITVFTLGALLGSCLGGVMTLLFGLMLLSWHDPKSGRSSGRKRLMHIVSSPTRLLPRYLHVQWENFVLPRHDKSPRTSSPKEHQT